MQEFSEENLDFWLAVEEYKQAKHLNLTASARQIYDEFVAPTAPRQVGCLPALGAPCCLYSKSIHDGLAMTHMHHLWMETDTFAEVQSAYNPEHSEAYQRSLIIRTPRAPTYVAIHPSHVGIVAFNDRRFLRQHRLKPMVTSIRDSARRLTSAAAAAPARLAHRGHDASQWPLTGLSLPCGR